MVPPALDDEFKLRRCQFRIRNWFTLFWLLAFSYVSQYLAFGPLDILNTSGGVRLLFFLGAFGSFLGGFVAFDYFLGRLYPSAALRGYTTLRRGRQL
jgi:hypothetical protein